MLNNGLSGAERYPDDIESRIPLMKPVLAQEKKSRLDHLALLGRVNRFQRGAEALLCAGFHFDKNNDAPVQDDQIKLADGRAVVPFDEPVSFFSEIPLGEPFALFA